MSFALGGSNAEGSRAAGSRAYRTISLTSLISSNSEGSRTDISDPSEGSTPSDEAERAWSGGEQMVDLRPELENPISDSPLLMNAYRRHLTQFSCRRWALPMHVREYLAGQGVHPLPRFSAFADAFSPRLMCDRTDRRRAGRGPRTGTKARKAPTQERAASEHANSSSKGSPLLIGSRCGRF